MDWDKQREQREQREQRRQGGKCLPRFIPQINLVILIVLESV
jgi:hypothetical protein